MWPMLYAAFWLVVPWAAFFGTFSYFELFPVFNLSVNKVSSSMSQQRRKKVLCILPNCIRCSKNEILLASARNLLEVSYVGDSEFERISDALEQRHEELLLQIEFNERKPVWEHRDFPLSFQSDFELLSAAVEIIKEDCQKAFDCPSLWSRNGLGENTWFIFPFVNQGVWQDEHCTICPKIAAILYRLKNLVMDCVFGNAFISMIPSDCVIDEHCGITNARLRCHLGIEVPDDKEHCYMIVGGQKFNWTKGSCTVIDDSFPHSVNLKGCSEDRTVLVVDFWNPQLKEKERECLHAIFSTNDG
uniref:Asp_Arg_Hydrox domain-containing protein n=1 Tax=Steinernema glaseri TaxID=37863 RepID=A0A1I8A8V3_9BILA